MHDTGHLKPVYWDNPEGWDGEADEKVIGNGGGSEQILPRI